MVHHHDRDVQRNAQGLCERGSHKKGSQKAGAAGEGDRGQVGRLDSRPLKSSAHHRHDVLFMGPGCQLRHYTAEVLMDLLACDHIGEQVSVPYHSGGGIVTTRLDSEDIVSHLQRLFFGVQR